jgi:P27 family predicted phage terminase small subunit
MRGRKRTLTARRLLEGNPSGRPINAAEPQPTPASADFDAVPRELDGHEDAATEWRRLAPMLRQAGQLTLVDRAALVAACLEWDMYLAAVRALQAGGLTIEGKWGVRPSPYIGIRNQAIAACNRLWPELGLTPTSRARLTTTPLAPLDDPFAEFDPPNVHKPQ